MLKRFEFSLSDLTRAVRHPGRAGQWLADSARQAVRGLRRRRERLGNVVMFHVGRSGSTVLGDMLSRHPDIDWDGEVCEAILSARPYDPIAHIEARMKRGVRPFYGLEIKPFHLSSAGIGPAELVRQAGRLGFEHFVVLERRNYLRVLVSALVARETRTWHRPAGPIGSLPSLKRIHLDVDDLRIGGLTTGLVGYLEARRDFFAELATILEPDHRLWLTYEDDLAADPRIAYHRLCAFLGLDSPMAPVRFAKTNPFPLTDILTNYEQVEGRLRGTPFAWMLHGG